MSEPSRLVQWPAIIKLHADHELIFVSDAPHLCKDDALQRMQVQARDFLIDSSGAVYSIRSNEDFELVPTTTSLSLHEVEALLRLHLANNGNCCVSKFHALSIREAILSVFA